MTFTKGHKFADRHSYRLMQREDIRARVYELQQQATTALVLSAAERREMLATMARTTVADLAHVNWSDATQVAKLGRKALAVRKIQQRVSPEGDISANVELVDRIAALREDAILAGERDTDRTTELTVNQVNYNVIVGALRGSLAPKQADAIELSPDQPKAIPQGGATVSTSGPFPEAGGSSPPPASSGVSRAFCGPMGPIGSAGRVIGAAGHAAPQIARIGFVSEE